MGNIRDITNKITTVPDDALIYSAPPVAGAEQYEDATSTKANLLKEDRARITTNEGDITTIQSSIVELQGLGVKVLFDSIPADISWTAPADSRIYFIGFLKLSGTPSIKVGTSSGADDIMSTRTISGDTTETTYPIYSTAASDIYFGVSGGSVAIAIIYNANLYAQN